MKDNFDLKKFLVENKSIENSNPFLKEEESREERADVDKYEYEKGKEAGEKTKSLQERIREMIINELSGEMGPEDKMSDDEALSQQMDADEEAEYAAALGSIPFEESLEEAKEEEEEEEETDESEEEETPEEGGEEEVESEETEEVDVETGGGIEDIAADMEGDEGDLMDHLISALKVSKAMDNEKLTTQIGNTLKFFVGEYIGGEE